MNKLKIIVALVAGLFAFTSVNAGEVSVTGSMQATYQNEVDSVTGNPLGMNTDLTFSGSQDTDFGAVTWTMATDGTFLGGATGNANGNDHSLKIATSVGTFGLANSGDAANAVDDITPSAFEEANGAGSGTYSADVGSGMDGSMSLSFANGDLMGTGVSVAYNYYPKLDGTTNNEKGASGAANGATRSAQSINVGIPMTSVPFVNATPLSAMKITAGYESMDSTVTDAQMKAGGTVAVTLPVGPLSVGYQTKAYQSVGTSILEGQDAFFRDEILGIAYAVNDAFAISYNIYESDKHDHTAGEVQQETKAVNIAYTIGGLTLGFQDAKTSNAGYATGTDDDSRTISLKTAF